MQNDKTNDPLADEYGAEYYACRFGEVPYERSAHWLNFFGIVADQLIRALRPRRVLDAGCAMGFLVESFWDRAVHCEGFDLSEYAISKVRRDIQPYCWVASLVTPIKDKYDLITCIEVLEHLPPEIVKTAVENLCSATDVLLFSSTPSDLEEPTHFSVHPPIYWLHLFAEFGFWPDVHFDASFVAPHAMLLRRGAPPPDDFLRLYSELIRFRTAFETRAAEVRRLEGEIRKLQSEHDAAYQQLSRSAEEKFSTAEQRANTYFSDRVRLLAEALELRKLIQQLENQRDEAVHLRNLSAAENIRMLEQVRVLTHENDLAQSTLQSVFASRGWKVAEGFRTPLRKIRSDLPVVHKLMKIAAGRNVGDEPAAVTNRFSGSERAQLTGPELPKPRLSSDSAYDQWIHENEPDPAELERQRQSPEATAGPLFSVVVPIHQTDHGMLKACLDSVLKQTYTHWQLCAAITPDDQPKNLQLLRDLETSDSRVRVVALEANHGISQNTNAALDVATGEYIVLLDHDDTLAPFALYEVAAHLRLDSGSEIIYSDHDYLDGATSLRCEPLFKPDWSPDIMLSANYITHLTVIRKTLLDRLGRFDSKVDGAQDWDLFLRASEATSLIYHIPKVLYHWRKHAGSTAHNDAAKSYVADAQLVALNKHLRRLNIEGQSEVMPNGLLHLRFTHSPTGSVTIVIPTKDRLDLLERCISTLLSITAYKHFDIIIVDNGSQEAATQQYLREVVADTRVRVLWHPGAFNYSAVNNRAAAQSSSDLLLFLNNDVEITRPDWLTEMVSWAQLPPVGIVGAKLLRADGTLQHAGVVLGLSGFADHPFANLPELSFELAGSTGWYRDYLAVTGACMMMRRQVFQEIGGFNDDFTLCGSDVEICLRAHERGYRVVYNPFAELIHHERQTRGTAIPPQDFVESFKHYSRWLASGDPYWSPNLSLWSARPAFRSKAEESSLEYARKFANDAAVKVAASAKVGSGSDEEYMVRWFDCSEEQFHELREQNARFTGKQRIKRLLWFIPVFEVAFYGGIYTILQFCDLWAREEGVEIFFAVCGLTEQPKMVNLIGQVFKAVKPSHVTVLERIEDAAGLPGVDASICTLWTTPYYALHHQAVKRRFYLIQDFEPAFYRAGSISALVDSTYRMGLYGIANTVSLKHMYETEYGGKAVHFVPRLNSSVFYADETAKSRLPGQPFQVFFYGRPQHPRNAFELVKRAMIHLKSRLGDQVRIVSAGDDWKPADYGLKGIVENLGVLAYEDTARLYRESDVGVVMMLTRHPSYIPLELMASGCLTVTNENAWTAWLLRDSENCLLTPATSTAIADTVERGLFDVELRLKIRGKALEMIHSEYLDWTPQVRKVFAFLCDPEAMLDDAEEERSMAVSVQA